MRGGPEGTGVGVGCNTLRGSQTILSEVQLAGLSHVVPILASTDDPWSIDRMLEKTRIVECSEQAADQIRERFPHDVEAIFAYQRLAKRSILTQPRPPAHAARRAARARAARLRP